MIKESFLMLWQQPGEIKLLIIYVFIVWIIINDGGKRRRKRLKGCPVGQLQEDLRGAYREKRQMEVDHKRQKSDLDSYYQHRLKKLERENSYLRSRLRNKR
jgi:hypothetical protein